MRGDRRSVAGAGSIFPAGTARGTFWAFVEDFCGSSGQELGQSYLALGSSCRAWLTMIVAI